MHVALSGRARTTLHVASFELSAYRPRVVLLERHAPLAQWCAEQGVRNAIVGGFFTRPNNRPLGQLVLGGAAALSVPFDAPWGDLRACVHIEDGAPRIALRSQLAERPGGDLLQAGPLLVSGGRPAFVDGDDFEGFSAGADQFDSDITVGRYPRAALGIAGDRLLAVACDGRTDRDAGMTMAELAAALVSLGASEALNLDGGGSASLVYDGRLRNRPREEHGIELLEGRPIVTAIAIEPRS